MIPTHREMVAKALELKAQVEEFRSATYTVVHFQDPSGPTYCFVAAFDLDSLGYGYTLTDANFIEIKAIQQVKADVIAAFGNFVSKMQAYSRGEIQHPFAKNVVAENPDVVPAHKMTTDGGITADHDLDAPEAELK